MQRVRVCSWLLMLLMRLCVVLLVSCDLDVLYCVLLLFLVVGVFVLDCELLVVVC